MGQVNSAYDSYGVRVVCVNLSLKYHPYLKNVQNRTILILSFTWNMFCVISSWYKKVLAILILTLKCFGSCIAIVNKNRPVPFSRECKCIALHLWFLLWFSWAEQGRGARLPYKRLCPPGGVISVYTQPGTQPWPKEKNMAWCCRLSQDEKKKNCEHFFVAHRNPLKLVSNERGDQNTSVSGLFWGKRKKKDWLLCACSI